MIKHNLTARREAMVDEQIRARGIHSPSVLAAMRRVRREAFVPDDLRERAYYDTPLPIAAGQTISQPMIVAMMAEALALKGGERVLDVGTGSGYAAAVIACIADKVYSIERIGELANLAKKALLTEGFNNVEVRVGDGSLGWPDAAPFDAINVAAGAPVVPEALKQQLAIGGRLVLPVGSDQVGQQLLRITRVAENEFESESLAAVRFVPLIGADGWQENTPRARGRFGLHPLSTDDQRLVDRMTHVVEPFDSVDELPLEGLLERIGDTRLVLLGESSHGTSEFYRARQRITRALIEEKNFDFIAIEGDWPDVARIDGYVRPADQSTSQPTRWTAFSRFPTWMWRNEEVHDFIEWLREHNAEKTLDARVAFHGLDLYSPYQSIDFVLEYLEDVDPDMASFARGHYACLTRFKPDAADYGRWASTPGFAKCDAQVADVLHALESRQAHYEKQGATRLFDALQNARLVVSAEAYYRLMYDNAYSTWNLRDNYMFDTLEALFAHHGEGSRGVIWAHNSHIGDARATDRVQAGELNIGQLSRERFGDAAYLIGFGTNSGTVAAASDWGAPMEIKTLRQVLPDSYERLCHQTGHAGFLLPLTQKHGDAEVRQALLKSRLGRAIGVIYRPEAERASHYYETVLPQQFDEYIWVERSRAVTPLNPKNLKSTIERYPFKV